MNDERWDNSAMKRVFCKATNRHELMVTAEKDTRKLMIQIKQQISFKSLFGAFSWTWICFDISASSHSFLYWFICKILFHFSFHMWTAHLLFFFLYYIYSRPMLFSKYFFVVIFLLFVKSWKIKSHHCSVLGGCSFNQKVVKILFLLLEA